MIYRFEIPSEVTNTSHSHYAARTFRNLLPVLHMVWIRRASFTDQVLFLPRNFGRLDVHIRSAGIVAPVHCSTILRWALLVEDPQVSPICASRKSRLLMKMSVDYWWNYNDGGNRRTELQIEKQTIYIYIYILAASVV